MNCDAYAILNEIGDLQAVIITSPVRTLFEWIQDVLPFGIHRQNQSFFLQSFIFGTGITTLIGFPAYLRKRSYPATFPSPQVLEPNSYRPITHTSSATTSQAVPQNGYISTLSAPCFPPRLSTVHPDHLPPRPTLLAILAYNQPPASLRLALSSISDGSE